jgi:hypothetical protein
MGNHMWAYMRRLLHALAEAGPQLHAQDLQPLMGPTGYMMWTETTRVPRRRPSSGDVLVMAEALPIPIEMPPDVDIRRPEPVGAVLGASQ